MVYPSVRGTDDYRIENVRLAEYAKYVGVQFLACFYSIFVNYLAKNKNVTARAHRAEHTRYRGFPLTATVVFKKEKRNRHENVRDADSRKIDEKKILVKYFGRKRK